MTPISTAEAAPQLDSLITKAIAGEEIVIVNSAVSGAVLLVPIQERLGHPTFGSARGQIKLSDDFDAPLDDFNDYMEPSK